MDFNANLDENSILFCDTQSEMFTIPLDELNDCLERIDHFDWLGWLCRGVDKIYEIIYKHR